MSVGGAFAFIFELTQGSALVLRNKRYSLRYQIIALRAFTWMGTPLGFATQIDLYSRDSSIVRPSPPQEKLFMSIYYVKIGK
jgi:hypothetical protein